MKHPRFFMALAFIDCVAVMSIGFGLMLQDRPAANALGAALMLGAQAFSWWYFAPALARRVRMRLTVQDEADLLRQTSATKYEFLMTEPPSWWMWDGECWTYVGLREPVVSANGHAPDADGEG